MTGRATDFRGNPANWWTGWSRTHFWMRTSKTCGRLCALTDPSSSVSGRSWLGFGAPCALSPVQVPNAPSTPRISRDGTGGRATIRPTMRSSCEPICIGCWTQVWPGSMAGFGDVGWRDTSNLTVFVYGAGYIPARDERRIIARAALARHAIRRGHIAPQLRLGALREIGIGVERHPGGPASQARQLVLHALNPASALSDQGAAGRPSRLGSHRRTPVWPQERAERTRGRISVNADVGRLMWWAWTWRPRGR